MPLVVDMSRSRRFAYALIDPPSPSPADLLRRAIEQRAGNPRVGLAASHYGAMMVVFASEQAREHAMRGFFPLPYDGHVIMLERPENGENRFGWEYTCFAQLSATGFPLEHWDEGGIRNAFRSIGNVCCIDPLCLNDLDFSAVRLVIRLEHENDVPHALLLRNFDGDLSTDVTLRLVRTWTMEEDGSSASSVHFEPSGGSHPPSPRVRRPSAMDDIDTESLRGFGALSLGAQPDAPPPPPAPRDGQDSAAVARLRREIGRRLSRFLSEPFPTRWNSLFPPATPLIIEGEDVPEASLSSPVVFEASSEGGSTALVPSPLLVPSDLLNDNHEHAARKRRGLRKRAVDSGFTDGRRSLRLAGKEPAAYVKMLDRAKAVKAARFDVSKGSSRLRNAIRAAGIDAEDGAVDPIPLRKLQAMGSPCSVDPEALAAGARAEVAARAP
ncbi:hypothetical protein VPH35_089714 [Triticum aestivum]|uniref:DUF4283 domain-containing protein n=1 Tax=Triticum aestivum TaxID=4565 RepID=A0A3B6LL38_WHEAT